MAKITKSNIINYPYLVDEWDYEKNKINPTEVNKGIGTTKYWWKCDKGHSYQATIPNRIIRGHGCPYCSNQKILVGFNDLGTIHPVIYDIWDYEKNGNLTPSDFTGKHSTKKIYLKCEKGHSYVTRISQYNRGQRCPICSNKKVAIGYNDLKTTHPDLALEWDYEKNGDLNPSQVTRGSEKKVWWKCKYGHSWKTSIYLRANGHNCPECLKEYQSSLTEKAFTFYLSKYFDDIEENAHPIELGKRELDIYIPSIKLAVEYDGYNWHKNISRDLAKDRLCKLNGITLIRIREDGCPKYETPSYIIEAPRNHGNIILIKDTINNLLNLINTLFNLSIPNINFLDEDIAAINSSFYTYNKNNSISIKCPSLLEEWDYEKNKDLTPEHVSHGSNTKVWWKCNNNHSWMAPVYSRVKGNGCPYCTGKLILEGFNDFKSQFPNLIKEWDYEKNGDLNPSKIYKNSNLKVWWKCEFNHSWKTQISTRTKLNTGCPVCKGLIADKGNNDLATLYPELLKEWDYEKNGDIQPSNFLPGSEKVVWWKCPKNHSYDSMICLRVKMKKGCPICNNKRVEKGFNDLATLHPEIAKEWDYEKNGALTPFDVGGSGGSHKMIYWKCSKGHEWKASLRGRISMHTGCPICARERNKRKKYE